MIILLQNTITIAKNIIQSQNVTTLSNIYNLTSQPMRIMTGAIQGENK